jgi:hypothetical protein
VKPVRTSAADSLPAAASTTVFTNEGIRDLAPFGNLTIRPFAPFLKFHKNEKYGGVPKQGFF